MASRFVCAAALALHACSALVVHLVPHTHDDVGWLKTVDEYFTGDKNNIQHANVRSIIDTSIAALFADPARKFTYTEIAFFSRWWNEQTSTMQEAVRGLVSEGRLSFVNAVALPALPYLAGWCMHDEAAASFIDMLDQTALGHRFIVNEFGYSAVPTVQWQIDPFGHSATHASLLSSPSAGFNSVFFARADYQDANIRRANKTTEFLWSPSPSLGAAGSTLGGILADYYYPPGGFNYGDDSTPPVVDDPTLTNYNIKERVDAFVATANSFAGYTRGDVMWTMGTDFSYENAFTWYANMDRLVRAVNADGRVTAMYSTPSIYAAAKIATQRLPPRSDDMFPYADGPHAVWAGYFTSRPALKGYIRECGAFQTAARQLQLLAGGAADMTPSNPLYLLERAVAVAQHHDAVSGTSKQAVAYDYAQRLAKGRAAADGAVAAALTALTRSAPGTPWAVCDLTNTTVCPALEAGAAQIILVYNAKSQVATSMPVRLSVGLPAGVTTYGVYGPTGASVPAQTMPISAADAHLRAYQGGGGAGVTVTWLDFIAVNVPALGYAVHFIVPSASAAGAPATSAGAARAPSALRGAAAAGGDLTNGIVTLSFDATTGFLSRFSIVGGPTVPLTQAFGWYNASVGVPKSPEDGEQRSGAYIFRPNSSTLFPVSPTAACELIDGAVVSEARLTVSPWVSAVFRLWANRSDVEVEWTVGPVPFADGLGKEIVVRYGTGWATGGVWYSDANGRDSQRRMRNARPSWPLNVTEPVADNYVPTTAFQWLTDGTTALSIVTDRAQGGASLFDGELEFMVHRRLQADDDRGVGEPLNETGMDGNGLIVRGTHVLSIAPLAGGAAAAARAAALATALLRPVLRYSPLGATTPAAWLAGGHVPLLSGLVAPLPARVAVLTLQSRGPTSLLLRLAHMGEVGDGPMAANATVAIGSLLAGYAVDAVTELTTPGVVPLASAPTVSYMRDDGSVLVLPAVPDAPAGPAFNVDLAPMQVRTFDVTVRALAAE